MSSGTPVIATADGKVGKMESLENAWGIHLFLEHEDYQTHYAHLSKIIVKTGEAVKKGDVIGYSGNSGQSTAPHLHYEVIQRKKPVNPIPYIRDYDFTQKDKEKEK